MYLLNERKLANSRCLHNLHVVAKVINFCQFFFSSNFTIKVLVVFLGGEGQVLVIRQY